MRIGNYDLSKTDHFVAMEYYWLILNRTYLLILDETNIFGVKVGGVVSAGNDPFAVRGKIDHPYSYVNERYVGKLMTIDLSGNDLFQASSVNFRFKYGEIESVEYTSKKKWGMAHFPHDGRIFIECGGKRKEFIIMGNQSGSEICSSIKGRVANAEKS